MKPLLPLRAIKWAWCPVALLVPSAVGCAAHVPGVATELTRAAVPFREATTIALSWLARLDAGDFDKALSELHSEGNAPLDLAEFRAKLVNVRRDWGLVRRRSVRTTENIQVRGRSGLALTFDTTLDQNRIALEEVFLVRDTTQEWRVAGYGSWVAHQALDPFDAAGPRLGASAELEPEHKVAPYDIRMPSNATRFEMVAQISPVGWTFSKSDAESGYRFSTGIGLGLSFQRADYVLTGFGAAEFGIGLPRVTFNGVVWLLTRSLLSVQGGLRVDTDGQVGILAGCGWGLFSVEFQRFGTGDGHRAHAVLLQTTLPVYTIASWLKKALER